MCGKEGLAGISTFQNASNMLALSSKSISVGQGHNKEYLAQEMALSKL